MLLKSCRNRVYRGACQQSNDTWKPGGITNSHKNITGIVLEAFFMGFDLITIEYISIERVRMYIPPAEQQSESVWGHRMVHGRVKNAQDTGADIFEQTLDISQSYSLGQHATMFQAKLFGIIACSEEYIRKILCEKKINIANLDAKLQFERWKIH